MRTAPLIFAAALAAAPLPTFACSPASGYRVPTNMELVESADLILLATVSSGDSDSHGTAEQMIALQPVEALKGAMPTAPIVIPAMIAASDEILLSNPYELQGAHPQSFAGACIRYAFPRGTRVLFFLDREGGQWHQAGGPFSRWAEDVLTDDAPWLQLVRFYIGITKLPEEERAAALGARHDELGELGEDPVALLIAADIDRQLAGPNPPLRGELPPVPDVSDAENTEAAVEAAADAAAISDETDTETETDADDITTEGEADEPRD